MSHVLRERNEGDTPGEDVSGIIGMTAVELKLELRERELQVVGTKVELGQCLLSFLEDVGNETIGKMWTSKKYIK